MAEFRDPCPRRVWMDMGGAFAMGAVAGTLWHGLRGLRNSPEGERFRGALKSARVKGPVMGGQFAVWGGTFSTCDCALAAIRGQEDSWNAISSGALTGAILSARKGPRAAAGSALAGGLILAAFEGIGLLFSQMANPQSGGVADFLPSLNSLPLMSRTDEDDDSQYRPETGGSI